MQGAIEILIDLNQFYNINLVKKGVYQMRVSLQVEKQSDIDLLKIYPYQILQLNKEKLLKTQNKSSYLMDIISSSQIQDRYFYSKKFEIKYLEQFITLEDVCIFRLQYPADYSNAGIDLLIKIDLLMRQDGVKQQENIFEIYNKWVGKIRNIGKGLQEFIPVIFEDEHICLCRCYLHTIQLDYKLTHNEILKSLLSNENIGEYIYQNVIEPSKCTFTNYQKKLLKIQFSLPQEEKQKLISEVTKIPQISTQQLDHVKQMDHLNDKIYLILFSIAGSLFDIWKLFLDFYRTFQHELNKTLEEEYKTKVKQKYSAIIAKEVLISENMLDSSPQIIKQEDVNLQMKQNLVSFSNKIEIVEDQALFQHIQNLPFIVEKVLKRQIPFQQSQPQFHKQHSNSQINSHNLVIFVHGFKGHSLDFIKWKCLFSAFFPSYYIFHSANCNQNDTTIDIWQQGINLSKEIKSLITDRLLYSKELKISFVCHSMGGLIARVAIIYLEQYSSNFLTFVSLGTPHVGLYCQKSKLVGKGLWVIKKISKHSESLEQITLTDETTLGSTFIWKLSENSKISWFKHIIFVGSLQDSYAPYHSACLLKIDDINNPKIQNHNELVEKMHTAMAQETLIKLQVQFHLPKKSIDSMIGRWAHIQFIDNSPFIRIFIETYSEYFL